MASRPQTPRKRRARRNASRSSTRPRPRSPNVYKALGAVDQAPGQPVDTFTPRRRRRTSSTRRAARRGRSSYKNRALTGGVFSYRIPDRAALNRALESFFDEDGNYDRERGFGRGRPGPMMYWDVSAVTDFSNLFYLDDNSRPPMIIYDYRELLYDTGVGQVVSNWDTSSAVTMEATFSGCHRFDQPLNWNTSRVTTFKEMFSGCEDFDQLLSHRLDPSGQKEFWNTSAVQSLEATFAGCLDFNNLGQPLVWDTSAVSTMVDTFIDCESFDLQLPWVLDRVTDMRNMFNGCINLTRLPFSLAVIAQINPNALVTGIIAHADRIPSREERLLDTYFRNNASGNRSRTDAAQLDYEADPWLSAAPDSERAAGGDRKRRL
jgi:hypothetical protein